MDQNPFLKQFLNMRKNLHTAAAAGPQIIGKKKGDATPAVPNPTGVTLAYLIENKPKDKEVIEYFKARCEALNAIVN
jgi:hypothetical protein